MPIRFNSVIISPNPVNVNGKFILSADISQYIKPELALLDCDDFFILDLNSFLLVTKNSSSYSENFKSIHSKDIIDNFIKTVLGV